MPEEKRMDFIRPVADRFKISHRFGDGFDFSDIFGGVGNYGLDFNTTTHAEVVAVAGHKRDIKSCY